jgi:hypothetical protein
MLRESHPSKEALDAAGTGASEAMFETFDQLDELLVAEMPDVRQARTDARPLPYSLVDATSVVRRNSRSLYLVNG